MNDQDLIVDRWLSERLNCPAFRLSGALRERDFGGLVEKLSGQKIFVDAKVAVDDDYSISALTRLGFILMDTNIQFVRPPGRLPDAGDRRIGFSSPNMVGAVGEIAERSFKKDRFHRDPQIPNSVADSLKREWAQNFFLGKRGDWMVVACEGEEPVGFLQLLRSQTNGLVIDLIAVKESSRGQGLARSMIAFAARECDASGGLMVGTQVVNVPSMRLYESLGFRVASASYVFHYHGEKKC